MVLSFVCFVFSASLNRIWKDRGHDYAKTTNLASQTRPEQFRSIVGYSDAEARQEDQEGTYLFQESDVKPGLFIVSYMYVKFSSCSED